MEIEDYRQSLQVLIALGGAYLIASWLFSSFGPIAISGSQRERGDTGVLTLLAVFLGSRRVALHCCDRKRRWTESAEIPRREYLLRICRKSPCAQLQSLHFR